MSGSALLLGAYLKDRRSRINPSTLGFDGKRRRTPGLRREEVALRANVSPTWYTWLEQGRGGQPSMDVLSRISDALVLQPAEREHLFMLANQKPLEHFYPAQDNVSPRIQRLIDKFEMIPAFIKKPTTEIVAWNRAAAVVLEDVINAASNGIELLRFMFCDPKARISTDCWEMNARYAVATFRLRAVRNGFDERAGLLVDDLSRASDEFKSMWTDSQDVMTYGEGNRRILHSIGGPIDFEYSSFNLDGQPHLTMVIHTPATAADQDRVRWLLDHSST